MLSRALSVRDSNQLDNMGEIILVGIINAISFILNIFIKLQKVCQNFGSQKRLENVFYSRGKTIMKLV